MPAYFLDGAYLLIPAFLQIFAGWRVGFCFLEVGLQIADGLLIFLGLRVGLDFVGPSIFRALLEVAS